MLGICKGADTKEKGLTVENKTYLGPKKHILKSVTHEFMENHSMISATKLNNMLSERYIKWIRHSNWAQ